MNCNHNLWRFIGRYKLGNWTELKLKLAEPRPGNKDRFLRQNLQNHPLVDIRLLPIFARRPTGISLPSWECQFDLRHGPSLHVLPFLDLPAQPFPPLDGRGLVQVRVLYWMPLPQLLLHFPKSLQSDQPPFTAVKKIDAHSLYFCYPGWFWDGTLSLRSSRPRKLSNWFLAHFLKHIAKLCTDSLSSPLLMTLPTESSSSLRFLVQNQGHCNVNHTPTDTYCHSTSTSLSLMLPFITSRSYSVWLNCVAPVIVVVVVYVFLSVCFVISHLGRGSCYRDEPRCRIQNRPRHHVPVGDWYSCACALVGRCRIARYIPPRRHTQTNHHWLQTTTLYQYGGILMSHTKHKSQGHFFSDCQENPHVRGMTFMWKHERIQKTTNKMRVAVFSIV